MSAKKEPPPSPSLEWFSVTKLFQSGSAGNLSSQEQAGKEHDDPEVVVFDEDYLMSMLDWEVPPPPEEQRGTPGKDVLMVHMLGDLDEELT